MEELAPTTIINHDKTVYIPLDGLELITNNYDKTKPSTIIVSNVDIVFFSKFNSTYTKQELLNLNIKNFVIDPEMMMKRQIEVSLYSANRNDNPFRFNEYKKYITDDCYIDSGWLDEEHHTSDWSTPAHYFIDITRLRLETDDELEIRKQKRITTRKNSKDLRRNSYLKLKKEFENEEHI